MTKNGTGLQIVQVPSKHEFVLDTHQLEAILLREDVANKEVVVLSVAGATRFGKSFILNFFIKYLLADGKATFLDDANEPLRGFEWRTDVDAVTKGIQIWSEPIFITTSAGKELVILLLDTEGAFDSYSEVRDWAVVFLLSAMISSVQIYNVKKLIAQSDLQQLKYFTDYGALVSEHSGSTPFQGILHVYFQHLLFLVRDWQCPYEYHYGSDGGNEYLSKQLEVSGREMDEVRNIRTSIQKTFTDVSCFLMPHPGMKVATSPEFDGRVSDIRPEFISSLQNLCDTVLHPDRLVVKEINGAPITARQLLPYFSAYMKIFQEGSIPTPQSLYEATSEGHNINAVADAKEMYFFEMSKVTNGPYLEKKELNLRHNAVADKCITKFKTSRRMGSREQSTKYLDQLEHEITDMFESFVKRNSANRTWRNMARTPVTFVILAFLAYFLGGMSAVLGVEWLAFAMNVVMTVMLATIALWFYAVKNKLPMEQKIDSATKIIWSHTFDKMQLNGTVPNGTATNVLLNMPRR